MQPIKVRFTQLSSKHDRVPKGPHKGYMREFPITHEGFTIAIEDPIIQNIWTSPVQDIRWSGNTIEFKTLNSVYRIQKGWR